MGEGKAWEQEGLAFKRGDLTAQIGIRVEGNLGPRVARACTQWIVQWIQTNVHELKGAEVAAIGFGGGWGLIVQPIRAK